MKRRINWSFVLLVLAIFLILGYFISTFINKSEKGSTYISNNLVDSDELSDDNSDYVDNSSSSVVTDSENNSYVDEKIDSQDSEVESNDYEDDTISEVDKSDEVDVSVDDSFISESNFKDIIRYVLSGILDSPALDETFRQNLEKTPLLKGVAGIEILDANCSFSDRVVQVYITYTDESTDTKNFKFSLNQDSKLVSLIEES